MTRTRGVAKTPEICHGCARICNADAANGLGGGAKCRSNTIDYSECGQANVNGALRRLIRRENHESDVK
jgi:hypothetical protein